MPAYGNYDGMTPEEFAQEYRDGFLYPDGIHEGIEILLEIGDSLKSGGDFRQGWSILDSRYVGLSSIKGLPDDMNNEILVIMETIERAMSDLDVVAKASRRFLSEATNQYPRDTELRDAMTDRRQED